MTPSGLRAMTAKSGEFGGGFELLDRAATEDPLQRALRRHSAALVLRGAIYAAAPGNTFLNELAASLVDSLALDLPDRRLTPMKEGLEDVDALAVASSPCARCGCGSLCHWDDTHTPRAMHASTKEQARVWARTAYGLDCQRCPKCVGGISTADEQGTCECFDGPELRLFCRGRLGQVGVGRMLEAVGLV